jgi:hypothetical protein
MGRRCHRGSTAEQPLRKRQVIGSTPIGGSTNVQLIMTYTRAQWRFQVEGRLLVLQTEMAQLVPASGERKRLELRIGMLERELRTLDDDDHQRGTQWLDEEAGAAADMW